MKPKGDNSSKLDSDSKFIIPFSFLDRFWLTFSYIACIVYQPICRLSTSAIAWLFYFKLQGNQKLEKPPNSRGPPC